MRPIAIIPARGGSKRIPRKNIVDMNGKPMIAYPIAATLESGIFSDVIVSTEDAEIKEIALSCGAKVSDRPAALATDQAFEINVYEQVLNELPQRPAHFCAVYPTSILLTAGTFRDSYAALTADPQTDVLMGVSHYPIHPFKALQTGTDGYLHMIHPKECLQASQTFPEYVASNGTLYWFRTDAYFEYKSYYPPRLKPFVLSQTMAVDIDVPDDLSFARALLQWKANA